MTRFLSLAPAPPGWILLPTGEEAAALDQRASAGHSVPGRTLIESAGRAAADVLDFLHPSGPVRVVAGKGNNGADGVVLARTLALRGRVVELLLPQGVPGSLAAGLLSGIFQPSEAGPSPTPEGGGSGGLSLGTGPLLHPPTVVVDALLGTGLRGAPRPEAAGWIEWMGSGGTPVLALDLPSGVDATTGRVPGAAVRAETTVAFGWPKLGTLLHPGRAHAGRIIGVEIGFPPFRDGTGAVLLTPEWGRALRPRRPPVTHKRAVGTLFLLAGGDGMAGAAILAARSALRTGVGLLHVATGRGSLDALRAAVPEAITVDASDEEAVFRALGRSDALAAGPGMGTDPAAATLLRRVLGEWRRGDPGGRRRPVLLDADALTILADAGMGTGTDPGAMSGTETGGRSAGESEAGAGAGAGAPVPIRTDETFLLTPHPGEFARLMAGSSEFGLPDRPAAARAAAARYRATVLLKGTPSLVASPGGPLRVDSGGSSALATGGMGDVLTGCAGALLALGCPPPDAASVALLLTGEGARARGFGAGLLPSDVIDALPLPAAPRPDAAPSPRGVPLRSLPFSFVTLDLAPPS